LGTVEAFQIRSRVRILVARITVKTLAAAIGVSPSTVSNAYNRPDQLSVHLRQRILAKADELGYAGPDAAGRTLRVGRADAVGVLLSERLSYAFSDPYVIEFLTGLSEVAERRGISITLMPLAAEGGEHDLRSVRQASIDAMALLSLPGDHPAAQVARARGIGLVTTEPSEDPTSSWVAIDDVAAGRLVGAHLAALGHRDVTVVVATNRPAGSRARRLSPQQVTAYDDASRLRGLRETVPGNVAVLSGGHNSYASGASVANYLVESGPLPTAVVGLSDVIALGALSVLRERGLSVPSDVSVCGFDDIPAARTAELTTVAQQIRRRGQLVGRLLVDPGMEPRQITLPIRLEARATAGPARR
jgi:DNA-binding LacI/PurR family transcriptional regulator